MPITNTEVDSETDLLKSSLRARLVVVTLRFVGNEPAELWDFAGSCHLVTFFAGSGTGTWNSAWCSSARLIGTALNSAKRRTLSNLPQSS